MPRLLLLVPLVALAVVAIVLVWRARARSEAGIVTSRLGRTLGIAASVARSLGRYLRRHARRALTPKARRAELDRRFHEETARQVLETMGAMKGVLMKLGQIASFMDDALPPAYLEQLRKLQTQAPPMDYETVVRVVRDELGHEPEVLFARFDERPIASASIGQVHRARLFDGTEVAVKVQYPGVDAAIRADLDNYAMLMAMVGAVMPNVDAGPIASELRDRLVEELDYRREAENQELFRRTYEGHPTIVIPRVFAHRSSGRVLTSEFIEGRGFYDFVRTATDEERRRAVLAIREFVFDSMLLRNLFNGDPHPGNYLFLADGRVAFLDFGCVKRFDPGFIADFKELNRHYLSGDKERYFAKACAMGFVKKGYEDKVDREWLWQYAHWFYKPILEDAPFRFTREYCHQALAVIFGENMRLLNMPAEYVMLNRITFGLNSLLAQLGACENWRRLSLPYYFPDGPPPERLASR